jgi:hypothetical protein
MHWPDRKDSGWGTLNRPGEFKNRESRDRQVCGRGATRLRRDFLARGPSFSRLMAVESWFSFLFASYNGALIVFLTEIMPADVRTAGFSLVHSSATAIFGGFTPAISTYLIHATGNRAISRTVAVVRRRLRADRDRAVEFFAPRAAFYGARPCVATFAPKGRIGPPSLLTSYDLYHSLLKIALTSQAR